MGPVDELQWACWWWAWVLVRLVGADVWDYRVVGQIVFHLGVCLGMWVVGVYMGAEYLVLGWCV